MAKQKIELPDYNIRAELEKIRGPQQWAKTFTGYDHTITDEEKERWEKQRKQFWQQLKISNQLKLDNISDKEVTTVTTVPNPTPEPIPGTTTTVTTEPGK